MRLLLIDNYDSFTYNLLQLLQKAGATDVTVVRNDLIDPDEAADYEAFVLSPGPGLPTEAGITCELIRRYAGTRKIFGVCLGLQAIAVTFGGSLYQPGDILHGEIAGVVPVLPADKCFRGMEEGFKAGLYHSWAVSRESLPDELIITCTDSRNVIMGLRHRHYDVTGVQFHPESVMTPEGRQIISNWLKES